MRAQGVIPGAACRSSSAIFDAPVERRTALDGEGAPCIVDAHLAASRRGRRVALTEQEGVAQVAGPADSGAHVGVPATTAKPIDADGQRTRNRTADVPDDNRGRRACITGCAIVLTHGR